jgi:hypothetical protein
MIRGIKFVTVIMKPKQAVCHCSPIQHYSHVSGSAPEKLEEPLNVLLSARLSVFLFASLVLVTCSAL